jgi:hypothetical protein
VRQESEESDKNSLFDRGSIGEMGLCVKKNKSQYMEVLGYPVARGTTAPIYVTQEVLSKAKTISSDQLEEWLESLDPEDFRYKA